MRWHTVCAGWWRVTERDGREGHSSRGQGQALSWKGVYKQRKNVKRERGAGGISSARRQSARQRPPLRRRLLLPLRLTLQQLPLGHCRCISLLPLLVLLV